MLSRAIKIAATTTIKAKIAKVITNLDLKVPVPLHSILGHGDISFLVALEACPIVVLLLHRFLQLTRTAPLPLQDLMALLITTSITLITSATVRRMVRRATTTTTMIKAKDHPAQALMGREGSAMADMVAMAAAVAVTASEDEEDAAITVAQAVTTLVDITARLTVDLVVALMVTAAHRTKDTSDLLTVTAVPTTTADQDDVGLGAVAVLLEDSIPSSVASVVYLVSSKLQLCLRRCGRLSPVSTHATPTTTLRRRTTRTSLPKPIYSTHRLHT